MKAENVEIFDRALKGLLNRDEKTSFKQKMEKDSQFRRDYEEFVEMTSVIESRGLSQEMEIWHGDLSNKDTSKMNQRLVKVLILLALLVLASLLIWFSFLKDSKPSSFKQLYAELYYADPGVPTRMGEDNPDLFLRGMVFYKAEQYDEALEVWLNLPDQNDSLRYFKAHAIWGQQNFDDARILLESIPADASLYVKAQWYLLMLALKDNDTVAARNYINVLKQAGFRLDRISMIEDVLGQD